MRSRWLRACAFADCRCIGGPTVARRSQVVRWMEKHEYWNEGIRWHLIVSSILLDGARYEDLP